MAQRELSCLLVHGGSLCSASVISGSTKCAGCCDCKQQNVTAIIVRTPVVFPCKMVSQ